MQENFRFQFRQFKFLLQQIKCSSIVNFWCNIRSVYGTSRTVLRVIVRSGTGALRLRTNINFAIIWVKRSYNRVYICIFQFASILGVSSFHIAQAKITILPVVCLLEPDHRLIEWRLEFLAFDTLRHHGETWIAYIKHLFVLYVYLCYRHVT